MTFAASFIDPFIEYGFMRRALVGCFALALGSAPVGVLLMLCLLWSFYRWVFDPVRELQQGAKRLGEGDFDHPIELDSGDVAHPSAW